MTHQDVYARGWLDTRTRIQQTIKDDPFIRQLITRNATILVTKHQDSVDDNSKLALILSYGRYFVAGLPPPDTNHVLAMSIGELVAPQLPTDLSLPEAAANALVKKNLVMYLEQDTPMTRGRTRAGFVAQYNSLEPKPVNWQEISVDMTNVQIVNTLASPLVDYLIAKSSGEVRLSALELFVTVFVSMAKRGTVSEKFIEKIERGMEDDLQSKIKINSDVISTVFKFYGPYLNADNAKIVFDSWLDDIPEVALRVRLTLQQVTGSGLTALGVIGRAMCIYSDFGWARLQNLFGGELSAYFNALNTVKGNPYYGFAKSPGVVRSTNYSSLAYVAKELLIRANGETTLRNYAGWVRAPKSAVVVRKMIDDYIDKKHDEQEKAEVSEADQILYNNLKEMVNSPENTALFA